MLCGIIGGIITSATYKTSYLKIQVALCSEIQELYFQTWHVAQNMAIKLSLYFKNFL